MSTNTTGKFDFGGANGFGALVCEDLGEGYAFAAGSAVMRRLARHVEQIAGIEVPVLLLGESGVGKEVAARLIHKRSPRCHRPFFKVNCAALPADLLESELFGFEQGAFTGAVRPKPGKFELCNKGTIFLDEIGEMPTTLQAKLLQVLEDQQFCRLGGRALIQVDVRIIAATNVEIGKALASRQFRQDLYYRLNAVTLQLPPLRERREEIVPLLHYFMDHLAARLGRPCVAFTREVLDACQAYNWPGNVRELQNFVKRCLVLGSCDVNLAELTDGRGPAVGNVIEFPGGPLVADLKTMVRELKARAELKAIQQALAQEQWNRPRAARVLGISTKALLHKMRQYGIAPPVEAVPAAEKLAPGTMVPSET